MRLVIITLLAGYTFCQDFEIGLHSLNTTSDHIYSYFRAKCEANGAAEAFETLKVQPFEFNSCLEQYINYTTVEEEVEEARKTGSIDEVVTKYCTKYPEIYQCLLQVNANVAPCLDPSEQRTVNSTLEFLKILKTFICGNEGNNMALFVAQRGVECVQANLVKLQDCFTQNMSVSDLILVTTLPKFEISEKECNDIQRTRICFQNIMVNCKPSTSSNVVEAFFKYIKKELNCTATVKAYSITDFEHDDNLLRILIVGAAFLLNGIVVYQLLTRDFYIYQHID